MGHPSLMDDPTIIVLAAVVGPLIAGLFGYAGAKFSRRKDRADAASVITSTALSLLAPLHSDIAKLSGRVSTLENENTRLVNRIAGLERDNRNLRVENTDLRTRVKSLETQILELGHTPNGGQAPTTITTSTTESMTVTKPLEES
jgi:chromosome segregation ATPase